MPKLVAGDSAGLGDVKLAGVVGVAIGLAGTAMVVTLATGSAAAAFILTGWYSSGGTRDLPFAVFLAVGASGAHVLDSLHVLG